MSFPTNFEQWREQTTAQLATLSLQIAEVRRDMVTRKEYNEAHEPLVRTIGHHSDLLAQHNVAYEDYTKGKKWLLRLGIATLVAAVISPHWSVIWRSLLEVFK